jgi:class 3 adenylate cyclase/tetratricopeptide (TPR) repeat protein
VQTQRTSQTAYLARGDICLVAANVPHYSDLGDALPLAAGFRMKCPTCEHENPAAAKFCERCAAPLARTCGNCGTEFSATANFCPQCGFPVKAGAEASPFGSPHDFTPLHLNNKTLAGKTALEGERKQVTVMFADVKGSMEFVVGRDPEDAQRLLDPVIERMIEAVHHYEGTVNDIMGDGIMALFGAPIAHEDHAVRACYAALKIQASLRHYGDEIQHSHGVPPAVRVGLNSGEIVLRAVRSDLRTDYTGVGETAHLAARMEQIAKPGAILATAETQKLAEGYVEMKSLGPLSVKGLREGIPVYEVTGAGAARTRLQAAAARGLTPFVNREAEFDQLDRTKEIAGSGRGQVVAIVGEAGVGKSRFVDKFMQAQHSTDWLVLESNSVSYQRTTPYLPVIELLRQYFNISSQDSTASIRQKVAEKILALDPSLQNVTAPLLHLLDSLEDQHPFHFLDVIERRQQTYQAVIRLLLKETENRPGLVVFEDLHWYDSLTLGLISELFAAAQTARLLLVVTYRPGHIGPWKDHANFRELRLDPLNDANLLEFLRALLGSDQSLGTLKYFVAERASGIPLFVEEIVRTLVETDVLDGARGSYRVARTFSSSDVPPTLQAVLAARIDALPTAEKRLLQEAAVVGQDVPFSLLRSICGLTDEVLRHRLGNLQAAEFLYPTQLFPELQYSFKHSLTRDVAYSGVLRDRRRAIHSRVLDAIEAVYADRLAEHVERLAYHAERGAIWDKALEYLQRSGLKAYSLCAHADAAQFFERALKILEELPETADNLRQAVDLRFELRNALLPSFETDRILRSLDELDPILAKLGDKQRSAQYAAFRCNQHYLIGQQRRAIEFGDTGVRLARECGDRVVLGQSLFRLGQSYHALGEYRQAISLLEQGLEFNPEELRHDRHSLSMIPSVLNRTWLAIAQVECGDFSESIRHAKRSLALAEAAEHQLSALPGWLSIGYVLSRKGEIQGAVGALERGLALCDRWSFRVWRIRLVSALAVAYARSNRTAEALQLAGQALSDSEKMRLIVDKPTLLIRLGQVSLVARQIEEALKLGKQAAAIAMAHEAKGDEAWARFLIGRAYWASEPKDLDQSEKELNIALRLATACEARPLIAFCNTTLCGIYGRRGDQARAKEFDAAATATYRALGMQPLPLDPRQ